MYLEFYGAAGQVTGSLHRLHVGGKDILLDCGLFQGHRAEANRLNREMPDFAVGAHCLVLSHAHLDHSGNLPSLVKRGFKGNIFCTPCTRDLCSVMLRDAAMIQEQDARYLNNRYRRQGIDEHVEPIYTTADATRAVSQMISIPYKRRMPIAPGVTLTFHNSGHVLGSALVVLDIEEQGQKRRLLFTGDLGRDELPLLQSPEVVPDVDFLLTESTYGDRQHPPFAATDDALAKIVNKTIERKGRVFIPTFALERAQEVLFSLERLHEQNKVPRVPIYIDSPLAIAITEIYKLHPDGLAPEVQARILDRNDPFSPPGLHYVSDVSSSKALQASGEPCIVIAGSGMCEGGRILHHFRDGLSNEKNAVVSVGFMAQHTLGRRLLEGRRQVKVFGLERDVRATIHSLDGLSAHGDRDDLVAFARETARVGNVRQIAIIHGEDDARESLAQAFRDEGLVSAVIPQKGERVAI